MGNITVDHRSLEKVRYQFRGTPTAELTEELVYLLYRLAISDGAPRRHFQLSVEARNTEVECGRRTPYCIRITLYEIFSEYKTFGIFRLKSRTFPKRRIVFRIYDGTTLYADLFGRNFQAQLLAALKKYLEENPQTNIKKIKPRFIGADSQGKVIPLHSIASQAENEFQGANI